MSSLTNINNNASVVNVGRTTPVTPGVKPASQSIPVVIASDQIAIPVIEQQKIQSEVALSLLGIPRGEVALGIFSDVNTYDVNPTEWSTDPLEYTPGHGIQHRPSEAGALVQAGKDKISVLSSKRFFRYQPGRVSAATFGVKSSVSPTPANTSSGAPNDEMFDRNPAIRKYGIFDKFDGYYWESRGNGRGDNFAAIRRTQALNKYSPLPFSDDIGGQIKDYRIVGKQADDPSDEPNAEPNAIATVSTNRFDIIATAYAAAVAYFGVGGGGENITSYNHLITNKAKCERDASFALDAYNLDMQYGGTGHSIANATTYRTALLGSGDPQKTAAEVQLHTEVRAALKTYLVGFTSLNSVTRNTRVDTLTQYTIDAVGGTQPTSGVLLSTSTSIWPRNKILTVFSIYKRYLAYLVSESFTGDPTNYTTSIKYKCYRDINYVVDAYARDLAFGGNSATIYNMKNFYFNGTLRVTTNFTGNTALVFHQRAHTLLSKLIGKSTDVVASDFTGYTGWSSTAAILKVGSASASAFVPALNLFGLQAATAANSNKTNKDKFDQDLFAPLYANFSTEYVGVMEFGIGSQFGDLVTLRDGLVHIHAAVFDPSLLKDTPPIKVNIDFGANNTLEVSDGEFVVNQFVTYTGDAAGLANNKVYGILSVSGTRKNIISLYDPDTYDIHQTKTAVNITSAGSGNSFVKVGTPFIFPKHYFAGPQPTAPETNYRRYDGMFPYMYAKPDSGVIDGNLESLVAADPDPNSATYANDFINRVGFINTSYDLAAPGGTDALIREIDYINYTYNNWIKQNVDPKYYAVYEYRVPRSRFSADKLDAIPNRKVVYSDVASGEIETGNITTVRPGRSVITDGSQLTSTSAWNLDPENVSMLKIEFSWYGAVGALFLAYVPVGNGEARWVRVHHMRASNQLKVASLGNATLPISYMMYGGGSTSKLGLADDIDKGYGSTSDHIVKYGASYYIDGGDRGTVRLYSHTNNINTEAYGKIYNVGTVTTVANTILGATSFTVPGGIGPADRTYFMKGQVVTSSSQDQNVQVVWVSGDRVFINKDDLVSKNNIRIVVDRPSVAFGLKAKQNIVNSVGFGVRNRVQVYPTKLSTANFASTPIKLDVIKTPLFQPNTPTSGTFVISAPYQVTSDNAPISTSSTEYLRKDEDFVYGWFRSNVGTVFGRLYRDNGGQYYFELKEVYSTPVTLYAGSDFPFVKDGRFDFQGNTIFSGNTTTLGIVSDSSVEKERLSSVYISNIIQSPVPQTGTKNASFFLKPGSDQFDLLSYFDYNKDYLSYPLTDEVSSIFLAASSVSTANGTPAAEISVGLTWEEQ
jgi:hypothetical protein